LLSDTLSAMTSPEIKVATIVIVALWKPQTLSPEDKRLIGDESESATERLEPRPMVSTSAGKNRTCHLWLEVY
jgi:hypothetical protein